MPEYDPIRIQDFLVERVNLGNFCFMLEFGFNSAYGYDRLSGANVVEKSESLVRVAEKRDELGDVVWQIVQHWLKIKGKSHVLVQTGIAEQLELFRQELLARGEPERAEQVRQALLKIAPGLGIVPPETTTAAPPPNSGSGDKPADTTNRPHVLQLIAQHERRLAVLEIREAREGYATPPEVVNEMADIRAEIARLRGLLES